MPNKTTSNKHKSSQKQEYLTEEVLHNLDETAQKSEQFIEKYARHFAIAFAALVVIAIGYFAYLKYILEPKNIQATEQMVAAQKLFNEKKYDEALGGGKSAGTGFADIAEESSSTGAGKVSAFYAGVIEYNKGNYQKALEYFEKFDSDDDIANAVRYGAIGDAYVQLKNNEEALKNFDKAANEAKNTGTKVYFLKKSGILATEMKKYKEALEYFSTISQKYPDVDESGDVEAYIEKLTYLNGNS